MSSCPSITGGRGQKRRARDGQHRHLSASTGRICYRRHMQVPLIDWNAYDHDTDRRYVVLSGRRPTASLAGGRERAGRGHPRSQLNGRLSSSVEASALLIARGPGPRPPFPFDLARTMPHVVPRRRAVPVADEPVQSRCTAVDDRRSEPSGRTQLRGDSREHCVHRYTLSVSILAEAIARGVG